MLVLGRFGSPMEERANSLAWG